MIMGWHKARVTLAGVEVDAMVKWDANGVRLEISGPFVSIPLCSTDRTADLDGITYHLREYRVRGGSTLAVTLAPIDPTAELVLGTPRTFAPPSSAHEAPPARGKGRSKR